MAIDWLLSNYLASRFGARAVNYIAPMTYLFFAAFWYLKNHPIFNGRLIYTIMFWLYGLYALFYGWHFIARFILPQETPATYGYALFAANGVYWVICITLIVFGLLKGIDNRVDGGLTGLLDKWFKRRD